MTQDTSDKAKSVGYRKLVVWQKADDLAVAVYRATKGLPAEERYGVTSQLRRSAVSIPTNIAEESGRQSRGERKQFLSVALGSLAETEYLLELCMRLGFLTRPSFEELELVRSDVGHLLWRLYRSV